MTPQEKTHMANLIDSKIASANEMFLTKSHSDAYIIGYLIGVLRAIEDNLRETK